MFNGVLVIFTLLKTKPPPPLPNPALPKFLHGKEKPFQNIGNKLTKP